MIALSVIAVSLIAVAATLGLRLSPSLRSADQRGESKVSLNTIVIAGFSLLLLVQVITTLVIVLTDDDGGTSSNQQAATSLPAADGTTNSGSGTATPGEATTATTLVAAEGRLCQPWEVYDPDTADAGFGGSDGLGGIWSSEIGCIRACYAQTWWGSATRLPVTATTPYRFVNASLTAEELGGTSRNPLLDEDGNPVLDEDGNPVLVFYGLALEYSLTDIRLAPEEGQLDQYATYQIVSSSQASSSLDTTQNAELGDLITVVNPGEEIRVSENQDTCEHIQTGTGRVLVDSDITRTIRQPYLADQTTEPEPDQTTEPEPDQTTEPEPDQTTEPESDQPDELTS